MIYLFCLLKKFAFFMNNLNSTINIELAKGIDISIINLIDELIKDAFYRRVSDIHIDPQEDLIRIRFRIDGILNDYYFFPKDIYSEIISRIKIISNLRIDEHYSPQDGRFRMKIGEYETIDIRISIIPTYYGENIVLRLLYDKAESFTLETLGFNHYDQQKIIEAIKKTAGMILITGPTGSGKTTTLYTLIKMLNKVDISIVTIEDPIEYAIEGVKQIQVNTKNGLTFANGLRSILRQDPNIIMVGEIRDIETASIGVNTALTGHLVLSTLHTNDSATTLPRLLDMKVESFLVASTVSLVIGQRLVRKICENCKIEKKFKKEEQNQIETIFSKKLLNILFIGQGCEFCNNTGYRGRLVISEILVMNNNIRRAILQKASSDEIAKLATKNGMKTMLEDGYDKAVLGLTTIDEILRVAYD